MTRSATLAAARLAEAQRALNVSLLSWVDELRSNRAARSTQAVTP